jgi:hypothetical protein
VLPITVIYILFSPCHYNTFYILLPNALGDNELTGSIPSEIGLMASLVDLSLCKYLNQVLCLLLLPITVIYIVSSSCHFNTFYILSPNALDINTLTGSIPSEIGLLTSLVDLSLSK